MNKSSTIGFVTTAMHGVGQAFIDRALPESFGFDASHFFAVEEQRAPDPDFPTVKFPNPEEKGALVSSEIYAWIGR